MKRCFLLRGRPRVARGYPVDGRRPGSLHFYRAKCDGQIGCVFTVHAGTFAQNPLQNAVDLFCGRRRRFPRIPQPVFHSRGLLGCSQGPEEKVLQIRGGHQDGHQLESLHFYGVPWPHRRGLKSSKKRPLKLTSFFKKAVCKIQMDRRLESLHFKG